MPNRLERLSEVVAHLDSCIRYARVKTCRVYCDGCYASEIIAKGQE